MEKLMNILKEIDDSIDYGRILDSFGVITLVSELEDAYGIEIGASEMTPDNFNSAEAIYNMVIRLQGN